MDKISNKSNEPKKDFGRFCQIPRILRTEYQELTLGDKWLYVCLKDLCGDRGVCFRSLRSLSAETSISMASLSTMIPKLAASNLIHAEKKVRSASGKAVWHISIVDIWQANALSSKNEQMSEREEEIVQIPNSDCSNSEQSTQKEPGDCSNFVGDCSNFPDRRIDVKNNDHHHHHDDDDSKKNDTPKLKLYQRMLKDLTETQKIYHKINITSEPLVKIQMRRYQDEQVEKYTDALDFFAAINVTLESLIDARSWLANKSNVKWFVDGNTIHIWDLMENWKKYLAYKNKTQAPTYQSSTKVTSTTTSETMTQDEAQTLATAMVARMDASGYTGAQSFAEVRQDGAWVVRMKWARNNYRVKNAKHWDDLFTETDEYEKSKAAQRQKVSN